MDTKTLDERIRDKARQELRDRIIKALNVSRDFTGGGYVRFNPKRIGTLSRETSVATVVDDVIDSIFDHLVSKAEEAAVTAFLAKVDTLDEQVQALRDEVNGQ